MIPSSFDESNCYFDKPEEMTYEDCAPLSVLATETEKKQQIIISCWKVTKQELEEINRTGRVWLIVYGQAMPPVALEGRRPYTTIPIEE